MDLNNPVVVILGAVGIVLNLLFSGGTLFKLIEFAKQWGATQQQIETHSQEIQRLRDEYDTFLRGRVKP